MAIHDDFIRRLFSTVDAKVLSDDQLIPVCGGDGGAAHTSAGTVDAAVGGAVGTAVGGAVGGAAGGAIGGATGYLAGEAAKSVVEYLQSDTSRELFIQALERVADNDVPLV